MLNFFGDDIVIGDPESGDSKEHPTALASPQWSIDGSPPLQLLVQFEGAFTLHPYTNLSFSCLPQSYV